MTGKSGPTALQESAGVCFRRLSGRINDNPPNSEKKHLDRSAEMADEHFGYAFADGSIMGKTKKQKRKRRQRQRTVQQKKRANEKRSTRHPEAAKRPANEKRDAKTKDVRTVGLKKQEPPTCYLCGREISTRQQLEYTCPKCGNRACSLCAEVMDSLNGVCIACDSRARKRKAIWDTIAFVGILVAIITILLVIAIYHFPWPARPFYGNGDF